MEDTRLPWVAMQPSFQSRYGVHEHAFCAGAIERMDLTFSVFSLPHFYQGNADIQQFARVRQRASLVVYDKSIPHPKGKGEDCILGSLCNSNLTFS